MQDFNRNEMEALRVLWEHCSLKPAEIQAHFSRTIDNGTLRSVLSGLVDKGHVARAKSGKAFYYSARRRRGGLLSTMARRMAEIFSGGSTTDLIAQLIEVEKLSPAEIEEIRRIAESKTNADDGASGADGECATNGEKQ